MNTLYLKPKGSQFFFISGAGAGASPYLAGFKTLKTKTQLMPFIAMAKNAIAKSMRISRLGKTNIFNNASL